MCVTSCSLLYSETCRLVAVASPFTTSVNVGLANAANIHIDTMAVAASTT